MLRNWTIVYIGNFVGAISTVALVFVSGQGPIDPATGTVVGETLQDQTRQALRNVDAILRASGTYMDKVVSATFILQYSEDFAGMNGRQSVHESSPYL